MCWKQSGAGRLCSKRRRWQPGSLEPGEGARPSSMGTGRYFGAGVSLQYFCALGLVMALASGEQPISPVTAILSHKETGRNLGRRHAMRPSTQEPD